MKYSSQAEEQMVSKSNVIRPNSLPVMPAREVGTLFRDPLEDEPGVQTISLTKIVCGPSESQLVMLQLETCVLLTQTYDAHTHTHIHQ